MFSVTFFAIGSYCIPRAASVTVGVGQPNKPEALSDVRRTDARSAQICRPDGVARGFHVSAYKVEPTEAVLARNLLSKDDWRAALADEVMPVGPQVPLIIKPASCTCRAERLARAASCPNGAIICPACGAQGVRPDPDACEEVALGEVSQFIRGNIDN
jgi:hypothetical protein